jgi:Domain of unknown function (DUF1848)
MSIVIVSASYKTDIPAFYGDWFMNRLKAGYCRVINPFSQKPFTVLLDKNSVDGFVFWTKNVSPFIKNLELIQDSGYPFIIQYTINAYPSAIENKVIDHLVSISNVKKISERFGVETCVWRYDTIIISDLTPIEFHIQNFKELCQKLQGFVNEVVVSFVQLYRKTKINFEKHLSQKGIEYYDLEAEQKRDLLQKLFEISNLHNIRLSICSQPEYVIDQVKEARCIDADRISKIAQRQLNIQLRGSRKECGCFESKDIGDYDTCPHGCIYCYAVKNHALALSRFKVHDPMSEFLFAPEEASFKGESSAQSLLF